MSQKLGSIWVVKVTTKGRKKQTKLPSPHPLDTHYQFSIKTLPSKVRTMPPQTTYADGGVQEPERVCTHFWKKVSPHLATRMICLSFYTSQNSSQNAFNLYLIRRWDDSCGDSFSPDSLSFFAFFQDKFRGSQPGSSNHSCSFFNLRDARKFRIDHSLASLFSRKQSKFGRRILTKTIAQFQ